ncbi:unnamed protein product [Dovyalis caffra]|uniref:Uncharacterized protein n=1 Tax=Dovyalis caffra TaxID=77055 RepID=A0AAV1SQT6_9ROSI|nr:unnamed protein product [Dovyalis caffra]
MGPSIGRCWEALVKIEQGFCEWGPSMVCERGLAKGLDVKQDDYSMWATSMACEAEALAGMHTRLGEANMHVKAGVVAHTRDEECCWRASALGHVGGDLWLGYTHVMRLAVGYGWEVYMKMD